ncbi:hypothetical protein JCM16307_05430 [Thermococcus prieurii]
MSNEIKRKVSIAYQRDVGRGIVRIDRKAMRELNVQPGDIVEIIGTKNTAAVVWPAYPEDEGLNIIRMDGTIRKNAGVGLGDEVTVRKADVKEAKKVIVAPTEPIRFGRDFVEWLHSRLVGRPVVRGDYIKIGILGQELTFVVTATTPAGIVQITEFTEFEVQENPIQENAKTTVLGITYEDIGGLYDAVQKIREMVELPFKHPELFERLGIEPPKGVLLYGPPGTGKTLLARAVINETAKTHNIRGITTSGPEIMSKFYEGSDEILKEIFKEAKETAPSIIFIDEVDAITPKRGCLSEVEKKVISQLIMLMDSLDEGLGRVMIIGTTNKLESIDPTLLKVGRFEKVIELKPPDKKGRKEILQIHTRGMPLEPEYDRDTVLEVLNELKSMNTFDSKKVEELIKLVESAKSVEEVEEILKSKREFYPEIRAKLVDKMLDEIADKTHGFVGADLAALAREAAMAALRRLIKEGKIDFEAEHIPKGVFQELYVRKADFYEALEEINERRNLDE